VYTLPAGGLRQLAAWERTRASMAHPQSRMELLLGQLRFGATGTGRTRLYFDVGDPPAGHVYIRFYSYSYIPCAPFLSLLRPFQRSFAIADGACLCFCLPLSLPRRSMNERAVWCGSRFLLAGAQQLSELANKHWSQKDHARAAARAALAHDLTGYLDQTGGVIFRAVRLAAGEALECVVDRGAIMDLCDRLRKTALLHPSAAVHLCRFLAKRLRRIESTTRVPRTSPATAAELRAAGRKHSGTTWQDRLEVEEVTRVVLVVLGVPARPVVCSRSSAPLLLRPGAPRADAGPSAREE